MIHQYIFAGPKPGLSAAAFQSYWVNFHAVEYAAKIAQIRQYLVAPRVHIAGAHEIPFFEGVAEIWLDNDQAQLASLQSPEFLQGARLDEPRWAAFWQTLVLDTDPQIIRAYSGVPFDFTKVYALLKRQPGVRLGDFRKQLVGSRCDELARLPGLQNHLVGFSRDGQYGLGEPRFDAVEVWSFQNADAIRAAFEGDAGATVERSWLEIADERYIFTFVGKETWIIRPDAR